MEFLTTSEAADYLRLGERNPQFVEYILTYER